MDPILTSFPTDVVKISLNCAVAQKQITLNLEACRDMSGKTFRSHPQHQLMRGGRCAPCAFWTGRKMWWELRPSSYWENIGGSSVLEVTGKHGGRFVPGVTGNKLGGSSVPRVTGKNYESFVPRVAGNRLALAPSQESLGINWRELRPRSY